MKFLEKLGLVVLSVALVFVGVKVVVLPQLVKAPIEKSFGAIQSQPIVTSMTNATTSINPTGPTQVFGANSFQTYALISNPTVNSISCYLESATAASSTLVLNAGLNIGAFGVSTSTQNSVCFGVVPGCIPYLGAVNCIASQTSTVGIIYK